MTRRSERELVPRNGHTLVVGVVARISGCANQKEVSLQDQEPLDRYNWYLSWFVQDDWKVTPTLTLNVGVRWGWCSPSKG